MAQFFQTNASGSTPESVLGIPSGTSACLLPRITPISPDGDCERPSVAQVQWPYECVDDGAKARSCSTDWQVSCKYRRRTSWQLLLRDLECPCCLAFDIHPCLLYGPSVLPAVAVPEYNLFSSLFDSLSLAHAGSASARDPCKVCFPGWPPHQSMLAWCTIRLACQCTGTWRCLNTSC